ncbi:unnamed protein product [Lactuca virosa]|uniref:NB-ARC domain-containing protein n=1 Tax=Lactuca virosa TaxID=75947 RepID=A0AAU9PL70_9ASTR|nr:unnamed protein product [Lactuca virosa]
MVQTKRFPSSIMKFFKDIFQPMRAYLASYSSSTNIALMEPVIFKLVSVVVASKRKEVTFSCSTSTPQTICDLQISRLSFRILTKLLFDFSIIWILFFSFFIVKFETLVVFSADWRCVVDNLLTKKRPYANILKIQEQENKEEFWQKNQVCLREGFGGRSAYKDFAKRSIPAWINSGDTAYMIEDTMTLGAEALPWMDNVFMLKEAIDTDDGCKFKKSLLALPSPSCVISTDLLKLGRSEGIDSQLNKWKKTLPLIQAVLDDAGQKQIADRAVQLWVNDLHNLAYDIDDVLDDLATEAGRRKLNHESHASTSSNKKINLGLNVNVNAERPNRVERRLGQTSLVDESKIMGREGDKEALLKKLLRNERFDQNVGIVSIVGLGGIGKTTLAKVVYNHEKVKDEFEFRIWVCVSGEFDVLDISKAILEAVSGEEKRSSNLDLIHVVLKEKLLKKKFLLVLDDVWNEDESKWELLQSPLVVGAPGSKIMVTTQNTRVVTMMDSDEIYHLGVLSNEDALSLFAQNALGEKNFDKHPTLKLHGEGIMKKCGRLPLALKTLGRVLKSTRNVDEWEKLLNSEIWDIEDGSEILPALKLSYYHLPPHLKQLFAYCSLFPKDYVFDKNELVLLWMAEGFLSQSKGNNSMESLGHHYFEKLKSRSFFQTSTNDELRYTMHGLINDLATSVAGEFFFRFDELRYTNETFKKFRLRHFSFINLQSYAELKKLKKASGLRTFLPMSTSFLHDVLDELLPKLEYLRVLSLANQITKGVPNTVGSLKHLRIGGLTSLQTLTKVIIEETNTFKISELKGLSDLQGRLSIMGLDKVIHPIQAKDASLHQKKGLDVLELVYSDVFDESRNEMIEYEVLKELTPHHNLKNLKILFFMGMRFPSWVGDPVFDQLTDVTLCGCTCSHLPTLGHLNSLKKLIVQKMNELKTIGLELLTPTNSNSFVHIAFPSLEVLKFLDMQNWEKWSTFGDKDNNDEISRSLFPRLHKIFIKHCPKLTQVSIGLIPSLRVLHIKECSEMVLRSMVGVSTSLVALKMWKVK